MILWALLFVLLIAGLISFTLRYYQSEGFQDLMDKHIEFVDSQRDIYINYPDDIFTNPNVKNMTTALSSPDVYLGTNVVDSELIAKRLIPDATNKYTNYDDQYCRSALQPANLPRHLKGARDGCGWWYVADTSQTSTGVLGTINGPVFTDGLPTSGQWIWDLTKAQELEEIKMCRQITACELIDANAVAGKCGFCPTSGYAVPVKSDGTEKYLNNPAAVCGGQVIMTGNKCEAVVSNAIKTVAADGTDCKKYGRPSADKSLRLYSKEECDKLNGELTYDSQCKSRLDGNYSEECATLNKPRVTVCTPDTNGRLTTECLLHITKSLGYTPQGAIYRILKTGGQLEENDRIALGQLTNVGVDIPPTILSGGNVGPVGSVGGKIDKNTAANLYMNIKQQMRTGIHSRVREAAKWFVVGSPDFSPCGFDNDEKGPFPATCLQQLWRMSGCQGAGTDYPKTDEDAAAYGSMSWGQIADNFKEKYNAMLGGNGAAAQDESVKKCLGISVTRKIHPPCARYTDLGCWADTWNRALSGPPQKYGYTVESCYEYAKAQGADTFALQDNGWCVTSKPGDDYKKYGRISTSCPTLGGAWNNHVYKVNK